MAPTLPHPNGNKDNPDADDKLTILVTGFGPFMQQFPVNPSFEIARRLPEHLPGCHGRKSIRIITYGSAVKVAFDGVRQLVPQLLDEYIPEVDIVLHIGMASGRRFYTLEQYAHRDGYNRNKDVDGKMPPADEGKVLFGDCPERMTTSLPYERILAQWQENIHDIAEGSAGHGADVRPSDDAGHYLCDYIYFNSLAYVARRSGVYDGGKDGDRPVLFLHVPAESDDETLAKGRAVAVGLIQAIADSYTKPLPNGIH